MNVYKPRFSDSGGARFKEFGHGPRSKDSGYLRILKIIDFILSLVFFILSQKGFILLCKVFILF